MKRYLIITAIAFLLGVLSVSAQIASDCINAIPICNNTPANGGTQDFGIDDFNGAAMSGCLERGFRPAIESNSAWYRFRTGASGQLGFNIGFDPSEDWDFALYLASDCGDLGDPVRCNFFDNSDMQSYMGVGEDPTGDTDTFLYDEWLDVEPGQDYYLLIDNYSNTNSGFSIQFSGQIFETNPLDALDCSIISNLLGPPIAACDNETIVLDASAAADALSFTWYRDTGTGYELLPGETGATLNPTISAMYRVEVITTSMTNIISDVQVAFSTAPTASPISDEAICSELQPFDLGNKDMEVLGPQDPAQYRVSYHQTQSDADLGVNALPLQYNILPGVQQVFARVTSEDNPRCFDASQSFELNVLQTPVLAFPEEVFICEDTAGVLIGEMAPQGHLSYSWDTGENSPAISVTQAGDYTLTVTNSQAGVDCISTRTVSVVVSETPTIAEVIVEDLQQSNRVEIVPGLSGNFQYQLDGGPAQASTVFEGVSPGTHVVTITDLLGCGSVSETITVVGFPSFFTPNGDGANDLWHIEGISTLNSPVVAVFDRYGKLIVQIDQNSAGWDGTFNGRELPSTDYWFRLTYTDTEGQRIEAKLVRNHFSLRR
ncbi:T9SS type B sorting domain-containing protein [Lentiprolixibacter aurantiacus]|uniref:T9SS type B sorting domain-containing protein n=1 Tax=Lentiprolixibacter aurantiacus TaxID=2993939 RepID=A0AAE3MNQ6_9FLAO|nr:T9SS type B sorting domain-containing protein [Lentiprolixibacter aurantiacus]MCX2720578.1 T9SS type B sorting domain-containing protein [Lentiprolixibacter aurantiacus]